VATGGPQILPWVLAEDLPPLVGALWTGRHVFLIEPVQGSGRPSSRGRRRVSAIPRCDDDPLVPPGGAENPENSRSVGLARQHARALAQGNYSPDQGQCNGEPAWVSWRLGDFKRSAQRRRHRSGPLHCPTHVAGGAWC